MTNDSNEKRPLLEDRHLQAPPPYSASEDSNSHKPEGGLSVGKCAVFIIAQMAGSGILSLPQAMAGTGWTGVFIMTGMCCLACYCGYILGKCWMIIREKNQVDAHVRDPYPLIGYFGMGKPGKYIAEICILLTLLGASIVFLLISSEQIASLLNVKFGSLNTSKTEFRIWILICGAALIPFTWFASPKEMWLVAYAASGCTIVACFLIIIRSCMKIHDDGPVSDSTRHPPTVESFFKAFGTIAFAFGGATVFPTFQTDMREPKKFKYAASLGFFGVYLLYLPVSILPYIALQDNQIDANILISLGNLSGSGKHMISAAKILITFHLLFAVIIVNNPISQQIEEYFKIPHRFGWKRILIRSMIMILIIAIGEGFPNFGPILSFVGASTVTLMCFILPAILYLRLQENYLVPLHQKVFHFEIILIAIVCGCCGIFSAVQGFSNPFVLN